MQGVEKNTRKQEVTRKGYRNINEGRERKDRGKTPINEWDNRKREKRTNELMDYKWLVPNVSGVFALLPLRWRNLLNQSEAFCPHSGPPVMISVISSHAGTFIASGKSHFFPRLVPSPSLPPLLLLHGKISRAGANSMRKVCVQIAWVEEGSRYSRKRQTLMP